MISTYKIPPSYLEKVIVPSSKGLREIVPDTPWLPYQVNLQMKDDYLVVSFDFALESQSTKKTSEMIQMKSPFLYSYNPSVKRIKSIFIPLSVIENYYSFKKILKRDLFFYSQKAYMENKENFLIHIMTFFSFFEWFTEETYLYFWRESLNRIKTKSNWGKKKNYISSLPSLKKSKLYNDPLKNLSLYRKNIGSSLETVNFFLTYLKDVPFNIQDQNEFIVLRGPQKVFDHICSFKGNLFLRGI